MTLKQFQTASRRGVSAIAHAQPIEFEYELDDGTYTTMRANPPTTGQLALFLAAQGQTGGQSVRAMLDFLAALLSDADYRIIHDQLAEGVDVQVIVDIVQYLTSEWVARPTSSRSGSSRSRSTTGRPSTVKPRRAASTTSR